jgi:hypothetical protein
MVEVGTARKIIPTARAAFRDIVLKAVFSSQRLTADKTSTLMEKREQIKYP